MERAYTKHELKNHEAIMPTGKTIKIEKEPYKKITDYIYPQLKLNPFFGNNIKKLKGEFEAIYRYRIGDYRLFYQIENDKVLIIIWNIDDRKDAYRK